MASRVAFQRFKTTAIPRKSLTESFKHAADAVSAARPFRNVSGQKSATFQRSDTLLETLPCTLPPPSLVSSDLLRIDAN